APTPRDLAAAAGAVLLQDHARATAQTGDPHSPWDRRDGWLMAGERRRQLMFKQGGADHTVTVSYGRNGLAIAGETFSVSARDGSAFDVFLGDMKECASAFWLGRDL